MKQMQTAQVNMPKHIINFDLAKFVCALLVVVIHTSPLINLSGLADFYLNDVIARIAVPLFFAISGFLFFRNVTFVDGKIEHTGVNFRRLLRTVWKYLILYVAWSVIYLVIILPEWYQTGWWGMYAVKDWLHALLFIGGYYHLWYLLALLVSLPVLYFLFSLIPIKKAWPIFAILWIMECLTYSYSWIGIDQVPIVEFINGKMPLVFDAAFRAVPLMAIGAVMSQRNGKPVKMVVCIAAFLISAVEASVLYFGTSNEDKYSYLLTTPFLTVAIMTILVYGRQISIAEKWQRRLRDMSLLTYCVHPMLCYYLGEIGVQSGLLLWILVTFLSVGIGYLWTEVKMYLRKQRE